MTEIRNHVVRWDLHTTREYRPYYHMTGGRAGDTPENAQVTLRVELDSADAVVALEERLLDLFRDIENPVPERSEDHIPDFLD